MPETRVGLEGTASPESDRYRLLLEVTDRVARTQSLPEALRELAPPVLALTGGELLNLSLYDPRQDCMLTHYWKKNQESGEFGPFPVDEVATGWAWKHQKPIAIHDTEREQRFPGFVPLLLNHGVRSYTVLPISTPSRHFGALALGKSVPEILNGEDFEFLARIALMGALALEKERAYRAFEEQQSLVAISRELSSSLELEKLLPVILSSLRSIARYERTILCLLDEDGKSVHRYGDALEWEPFVNHGVAIPLEQSLSARAIQRRNVAFLTAADLYEMNEPLAKAMYEGGVRSVCSVPLIAGNQIWGALNPSSMIENAFGPTEIEYLQQVANQIAAALQNAHAYREIAQLKERLAQEKRYLEYEIRSANPPDDIVGNSPALKRVLDYAGIVADTDSTVLITGETGTGKELIARAIHRRSHRFAGAFVSVNCAAIPRDLIASELFGHEKGAFTGATQRRLGRFELAGGGTIFLDEVGELPAETQIALLRVLQEHEFERVGGTRSIHTDVRVITATNCDLQAAIATGVFRSDLFYRLNVFPIEIPPLRDRREDIPLLVEYFIDRFARKARKSIPRVNKKTWDLLRSYPWPGNIRELQNVIERSVIVCETDVFSVDGSWLPRQSVAPPTIGSLDLSEKVAAQEKEIIEAALRDSGGRVFGPLGAAAKLGIPRSTLESKIRSLKIDKGRFKTAAS